MTLKTENLLLAIARIPVHLGSWNFVWKWFSLFRFWPLYSAECQGQGQKARWTPKIRGSFFLLLHFVTRISPERIHIFSSNFVWWCASTRKKQYKKNYQGQGHDLDKRPWKPKIYFWPQLEHRSTSAVKIWCGSGLAFCAFDHCIAWQVKVKVKEIAGP